MTALEEDCRKLLGLEPFNTWTNTCFGDGFYYKSLCEKYGEDQVKTMCEKLKKCMM